MQVCFSNVDAAAVYHNASIRFTDGESLVWARKSVSLPKNYTRAPWALRR